MNNSVGIDNLTRPDPDDPTEIAEVIANIWNATIFDKGNGDGAEFT